MSIDTHEETAIRAASAPADAAAIAAVYNPYIRDTVITFEEEPVSNAEMSRRIEEVRSASFPWLVAEQGGQVVGYAYARPWHSRSAYRYSAEIAVYLSVAHTGRGIGSKLYAELFPILQARGIHVVMGGIALPNEASVALHERFGLRKVAEFREVGFKFDRWIDVGYWQRTL
jgi:phosphinothricin acetyltransferase